MTWTRVKKPKKEVKRMSNQAYVLSNLQASCDLIIGMDEAGWGPIAGPMVVAGCAFHKDLEISPLVRDSKKLTEAQRIEAYNWIIQNTKYTYTSTAHAIEFKLGASRVRDRLFVDAVTGIVRKVEPNSYHVVVDGSYIPPGMPEATTSMVKGDAHSAAVAAASILAKVTHDRIMCQLAWSFPEFGWAKNKGYATKDHLQAIETFGVTPIHRMNIKRLRNYKEYVPASFPF